MKILIFCSILATTAIAAEIQSKALGLKSTNCTCGVRNKEKVKLRIFRGEETLKNEFPFMAGIYNYNLSLIDCGATILTKRHVLTAAHCASNGDYKVGLYIGGHDYLKEDNNSQILPIMTWEEHKNYSEFHTGADIAILYLEFPLTFNDYIGPACLPTGKIELINQMVTVIGWGRMESGNLSNVLRKVDLRIIPLTECAKYYPIEIDEPIHICNGFEKGKDSCKGDSGSPLLWLDPETNRYTVVGIVSTGSNCGEQPALNIEVAKYLDWIQYLISITFELVPQGVKTIPSGEKSCSKIIQEKP